MDVHDYSPKIFLLSTVSHFTIYSRNDSRCEIVSSRAVYEVLTLILYYRSLSLFQHGKNDKNTKTTINDIKMKMKIFIQESVTEENKADCDKFLTFLESSEKLH